MLLFYFFQFSFVMSGHSHLVQYLLDHTLPVDPKDKLGAAVAKRHRVDIDKVLLFFLN